MIYQNQATKVVLSTRVKRSYLKPCMYSAAVHSNIEGQDIVWQAYFGCRHKARRAALYHAHRLTAQIHVHRMEDLPQ